MLRRLLVIGLLCGMVPASAQTEWKQVRDRDGIQVFTRLNEGYDFKEFRGEMTVSARLSEFVAVLQDVAGLPSWGYKVRHTRLLEQQLDTVQVYYLVADTPFPYHDRDGVYRNVFQWNDARQHLHVDIQVVEVPVDREEGMVAMKGFGSWEVWRLQEDRLKISFQMQIDPGGGIPAWLSNLFAGDSPYHTLRALKGKLKDPAYGQKQFSFLE